MPIVDFHNHLIPGVDDGAQTLAESENAAAAFVAQGVTAFVATPHVDAGLSRYAHELERRLAEIDAGWEALSGMCREKWPQLQIYRAVELLLDVPEPDLSDPRLRIDGGQFFLFEFPYMNVPPHSSRVLERLSGSGYTPILAHPERYNGIASIELAGEWRQAGAYLQVNGGSLLGKYGRRAQQLALEMLRRGWVDYICSDYHARGRLLIAEYEQFLIDCGAAEQAQTLMHVNPARLLRGEVPLPIMPMRAGRGSIWQRIGSIFR